MRIEDRPETLPNDGARPRVHGSRFGPGGKTYADLDLKPRAKAEPTLRNSTPLACTKKMCPRCDSFNPVVALDVCARIVRQNDDVKIRVRPGATPCPRTDECNGDHVTPFGHPLLQGVDESIDFADPLLRHHAWTLTPRAKPERLREGGGLRWRLGSSRSFSTSRDWKLAIFLHVS